MNKSIVTFERQTAFDDSTQNSGRNPWRGLETCGLSGPASHWRKHLGSALEVFVPFLQKRNEPETHLACDRCGCAHEVITYDHNLLAELAARVSGWTQKPCAPNSIGAVGSLVAVCRCADESCPPLTLQPSELQLWEFSWAKFGRALCSAFGLSSKPAELGLPRAKQIGIWSSDAVPALLTIPAGPDRLRANILELNSRLARPFILLAPTNRDLDANSQEVLARSGSAYFSLEANLRLSGHGALHCLKTPGELFQKFTPQPKELDQSVAQRAFALIEQLDSQSSSRPPSVLIVFRLYCIEEMTVLQIARKCRCSKLTVLRRLSHIRIRTGVEPLELRRFSAQLERTKLTVGQSPLRHGLGDESITADGEEEPAEES